MTGLLNELKRRHVFKVAAVYAVVGWLVIQIAATTFPHLGLSGSYVTAVIAFVILGFPVALVLAWAFDLTPDGLRRAGAEAGASSERAVAATPRWRWGLLMGGSAAVLLGLGVVGWMYDADFDGGRAGGAIQSVAVLPFANLSSDRENDYFSDGISEEILNALASVGGLRVPARMSALRFKGEAVDVREVASALGVQAVVEGTVRRAGDRVRITAKLVSAGDGYQLWSASYDREVTDIFAVQEEIAREIVSALRIELGADADARLGRRQTVSTVAYEHYLKGRHLLQDRTRESMERAAAHFRDAISVDPDYALAHSGLADAQFLLWSYGHAPRTQAVTIARAAVDRALALDPELAEARASNGLVLLLERGAQARPAATAELRRATELNPSYAPARHWYSAGLAAQQRMPEALAQARRAVEIDPLSPNARNWLGLLLYYSRDYEAAIPEFEQTLALEPRFSLAMSNAVRAHTAVGNYDAALELVRRLDEAGAAQARALNVAKAILYSRLGREADARTALRLEEQRGSRLPHIAGAYAALGDADAAFRALDRVEWHQDAFVWLFYEPAFDDLRQDPRYRHLLERLGVR